MPDRMPRRSRPSCAASPTAGDAGSASTPGWYPLVIATDQRLVEIDAEYVVHQIKEKFGTLRYYYWPSSEDASPELLDAMDTITDDAERASAITCERCGEPGVLQRTRFWAKTLCHACADPLGYAPVLPQDLV